MHRLCKDSNTQMCRLQLNTRTAHFQANHVPVRTLLFSTVESTWSEHPLQCSGSRFSSYLSPNQSLIPVFHLAHLKHQCKIILHSAVLFMWRIQIIHEIVCNLCVASFPLHKGFDLKNWFVLGNSQMFIQESFDLNKKLSRLKTSVLTL